MTTRPRTRVDRVRAAAGIAQLALQQIEHDLTGGIDAQELAAVLHELHHEADPPGGVFGSFAQLLTVAAQAAERVEPDRDGDASCPLIPLPDTTEERPPGPAQHGPYTRYVHADGERMTFTRGRVVVAELRRAGWLEWLEDWARSGRQGYMDPKQSEAFAEFLARQPPVGEQ